MQLTDKLHLRKEKKLITFFVCCWHNWAPCQPPKSEVS